jgi:hypothetical protein
MELEPTPKAYKVRRNNVRSALSCYQAQSGPDEASRSGRNAQNRAVLCEQCLDFPRPVTEKGYRNNDRDEVLEEVVRQFLGTSLPSKAIEDMVKP